MFKFRTSTNALQVVWQLECAFASIIPQLAFFLLFLTLKANSVKLFNLPFWCAESIWRTWEKSQSSKEAFLAKTREMFWASCPDIQQGPGRGASSRPPLSGFPPGVIETVISSPRMVSGQNITMRHTDLPRRKTQIGVEAWRPLWVSWTICGAGRSRREE